MADPVFLITGASSGIGAATAQAAAKAGFRLVMAARSRGRGWPIACGRARWARARPRGALRRHRVADRAAGRRARWSHFGRIDVAFANAGFGAKRGSSRIDARALARDGPHKRLRRRTHDPRDAARSGSPGSHAPTGLGGGRGRSRVALLVHEVVDHGDGRGLRQEERRQRHARHGGRARHGRHPLLRRAAVRSRSSPTT